jgi:hypothetical protein
MTVPSLPLSGATTSAELPSTEAASVSDPPLPALPPVPVAPPAPLVDAVLVIAPVVPVGPAPVVAADVDPAAPAGDESLLEQLATTRQETTPTRYQGARQNMVLL